MKNKFILVLIAVAGILVSCNVDDFDSDKFDNDVESGFVAFRSSQIVVFFDEDDNSVSIPINYSPPVNLTETRISYSVDDVSGNASTLDGLNGVAVVQGGTRDAFIEFEYDNSDNFENVIIDLTLTDVNKDNVTVGLSDDIQILTQRIIIARISDTYTGVTRLPELAGGVVGNPNTVIVTNKDGNMATFSDVADGPNIIAAFGLPLPAYEADVVINPTTLEVTLTAPNSPLDANGDPIYTGGEGTYDPITDTFELIANQMRFTVGGESIPFRTTLVGN